MTIVAMTVPMIPKIMPTMEKTLPRSPMAYPRPASEDVQFAVYVPAGVGSVDSSATHHEWPLTVIVVVPPG